MGFKSMKTREHHEPAYACGTIVILHLLSPALPFRQPLPATLLARSTSSPTLVALPCARSTCCIPPTLSPTSNRMPLLHPHSCSPPSLTPSHLKPLQQMLLALLTQ